MFKCVLEIPGCQFVTTELTTKRLLQSYVDKKDILKEKVNTVKPCQIDYMFHRLTRPIIMYHSTKGSMNFISDIGIINQY